MYYFFYSEKRNLKDSVKFTVGSSKRLSNISIKTILSWFQHYREMGELPCQTQSKHGRKWRSRGKSSTSFSHDEWLALEGHLKEEPILYLDEMVTYMMTTFQKGCSISQMSRLLKSHGYTRMKVYEKACQAIQLRKDLFVGALRVAVTRADMVLFIDESSKDRLSARRRFGYGKKGKRINYRAPFNMDTRYTLIGCADCYGFVLQMCDVVMHRVDGKEESKPLTSDSFLEYFRLKVAPSLGNHERGEKHSVVVMDNCSIHFHEDVLKLITARGAILIYSAPYGPDLIPIESMFGKWKSYLKRFHVEFGRDWRLVHDMALASVTPAMGLKYFKMTTLVELVESHPLLRNEEDDEVVLLACATAASAAVSKFVEK
jgi:transposase